MAVCGLEAWVLQQEHNVVSNIHNDTIILVLTLDQVSTVGTTVDAVFAQTALQYSA